MGAIRQKLFLESNTLTPLPSRLEASLLPAGTTFIHRFLPTLIINVARVFELTRAATTSGLLVQMKGA